MLTNVAKDGKESYDAKEILKAYKDQYGIEQNFGFLKDPVIVNSIFLKRPERIEVLGLVLLLSLLIWRLIERQMRQYVQREKRDLPGWKRRRTTRPTTFMLMTNFQRIMIIKIGAKSIPVIDEAGDPQRVDYDKIAETTDGLSGADVAAISNTAVSLVIHEFLDKHPDVKDVEKSSENAKVGMKHFEEAVKKVREQKDLKIGEKLVASYYR